MPDILFIVIVYFVAVAIGMVTRWAKQLTAALVASVERPQCGHRGRA